MKILIDTNIFLEILLAQSQAKEAKELLADIFECELYLTDFTIHSIGLILFQRRMNSMFSRFIADIAGANMNVLSLSVTEMEQVVAIAGKYMLDFDDAYQYVVAENHGLCIVSYDKHFDKTKLGHATPSEIIKRIR
jgi:predicted nucleic acid-binding protein